MTTTGIVLAGGRSSRFGGDGRPVGDGSPLGNLHSAAASKLDADLGGRTVLDRTVDAVTAVCDEVLVVGPAAGDRSEVRYLPDAAPFEGPLAGLAVGLDGATGDVLLVVGGDMPLAGPEVLRLLVTRLEGPVTAAVLDDGAGPRPLPMALRRDPAAAAASDAMHAGERSLRALLGRLDTVVLPIAEWRELDPALDTLLDIDTPADLERARARLAAR
ncbi:MAG: molybdenum cofactor guanylyltransferase [Chloroflexi bacterium]|nr:molybdenum cofactor guanylyltransferase [Chloroflexota bacterium]